MNYQISQKFKHKKYGFEGQLVCIDYSFDTHIIECLDKEECIKWKGPEYRIEQCFDLIK